MSLVVSMYTDSQKVTKKFTVLFHKVRIHGLLAYCKSCVRCFRGKIPNLNPVQWREGLEGRFERFARPARFLYLWVLWTLNNPYDRKEIIQNNEKSAEIDIKKRIRRAPFLTQHNGIGKVIKRFRTTIYWPWSMTVFPKTFWTSFIILNLWICICRKKLWPRCVKISCQKISTARKLTFDLLVQCSTCGSLYLLIHGI